MPPNFDIMTLARVYYHGKRPEDLQNLLDKIDEVFSPPPDHKCSWCGKTDSENEEEGFGPLIDIYILIHNNEEGQDEVLRWMCQDHFEAVVPKLIDLGFGSHAHNRTGFLEDRDCVGSTVGPAFCPSTEDDDD